MQLTDTKPSLYILLLSNHKNCLALVESCKKKVVLKNLYDFAQVSYFVHFMYISCKCDIKIELSHAF